VSIITFVDIRNEAVDQIKAAFSENKKLHIAAHPGQFNEAEIKRLASQTPAILTSFMRYADDDRAVHLVSWVLYRADNKDRLYDGALKIVSASSNA
jgi:phage gp37-like protein